MAPLAVVFATACTLAGPTPAPPRQPLPEQWPTLQASSTPAPEPAAPDDPALPGYQPAVRHAVVPEYNSKVVALRTTLGRSAIKLEMRSSATHTIQSSACNDPNPIQKGCFVCTLAGETDDLDSAVLDELVTAFNRYPADVLDATHIEKVAICNKLEYVDITAPGVIGTVDLKEKRLVVSLDPFIGQLYDGSGEQTTEDIVHHELFHLFEFERMRATYNDDPEWRLYNPLGFEYSDKANQGARPAGFVDIYATTAEIEDKASVYQYMMARPAELCEIENLDAAVKKKVDILRARIAAITSSAFLDSRARCSN